MAEYVARQIRYTQGYNPVGNDDERVVFERVQSRVNDWLAHSRILKRELRYSYTEINAFATDEAWHLFEHARKYDSLFRLLPTMEACQVFVLSILFALTGENNRPINPTKKRARVDSRNEKQRL